MEIPFERMSLRQHMTQVERLARDLSALAHSRYVERLHELREASAPIRKKSPYPTLLTLRNNATRFEQVVGDLLEAMAPIQAHLDAIRVEADKELRTRKTP